MRLFGDGGWLVEVVDEYGWLVKLVDEGGW